MINNINNKSNNIAKDNKLFCELFKNAVSNNGDKIAVRWKNTLITYNELDKITTLISQCIAGKGLGAEEIIAIKMGRSINSVAAMIGILKAGAAFLFLDSNYPEERLGYMLTDSRCKLIINEDFMDNLNNMVHCEPNDVKPENLAVVIYTSGSTGIPKGVMIEQRNIACLVCTCNEIGITENDIFGVFPGFSFVATLNDIFTPLALGGTIDIIPDEIRKDIVALAEYYIKHEITITYLPPHMARKFMKFDNENLTLKTLIVGSEPAHHLKKRHYKTVYVYAATELCCYVSCYTINEDLPSYPIGKIKYPLKFYILDENNNEVNIGEVGELCISGPQVSRGYLNNSEKTAMHYIQNPFTQDEKYKILFKTSDLVKVIKDGNLIYISRKDWMFKIRGFRVESSEVELAMLKHVEITDAAVTAFEDDGGINILCGYFVANVEIDSNDVKEFLKIHIPSYMVPSIIMQLNEFPRNHNNKINKSKLPIPNLEL
ncbi:MAG: amino acid adenylation enzyme/thioester reductase family protein [Bacillota bacterium]|jgi:amino acid adenylation domain-containing protein|nr:amino acid adenylation enzyme/thioester reductase family protein [Bacillota bacterium]